MSQPKSLFALDLGTTKFCVAALQRKSERHDLKIVEVPAAGMKRGMLTDFSQAKNALDKLIEKAEEELQTDIRKIVVGVAGSHLQGDICEREIAIQDPFIAEHHLHLLSNLVQDQKKSDSRETLHCIPVNFSIDNREPIQNPINFTGQKLAGKYFLIDADRNYLKDVIRLCNLCGLEVDQLYSEPFASASVTVDDELKQLGVAVADIGGGTTDGIVFQNGRPVDIFTINIAGSLMTKDISVGLNLSIPTAQQLKEEFGLGEVIPEKIRITDIHNQAQALGKHEVIAILGPRVIELGAHLANNLKPYKGSLGGGILFTGGGSNLRDLDSFLSSRFKVSVHQSKPNLDLAHEYSLSARYATVVGLLNLEMGRVAISSKSGSSSWPRKYFSQFINWMKELA